MASINISEAEFFVLATAAAVAKSKGDMTAAQALDKLARKANAALTNARYGMLRQFTDGQNKNLRWTDVESTLT